MATTFEQAMEWLRFGEPIRRRSWHPESRIFRLGADVFIQLPRFLGRAPAVWHPYPDDFLATDWVRA